MKKLFILISFVASGLICGAQPDYAGMVDPFIGTGGHGHTYPGATLPFGMVQLSPDTRIDGSWDGCGGYHYDDSLLYGFSHTHLSGTGCSDYGDILLMPFTGKFESLKPLTAHFLHSREKASPGFYAVHLEESSVDVELTATTRVGFHKYVFPASDEARVLVDLTHRDEVIESEIRFLDKTHVVGFRRSKAWAKDQLVYFAIEFSQPYEDFHNLADNVHQDPQLHVDFISGKNVRSAFRFVSDGKTPVLVKVALSSVSTEGALMNLHTELPDWDFEKAKSKARAVWNKELSKIEISGGTKEQQVIFYTALYHCMVVPNIYNDVDGNYRGRDFNIHKAEGYDQYTVFSLWDTFRAWHPLMTIIDRKRTRDYIQTFLAQYDQGGLLPVWELSANETECMIGYHAIPVIADAWANGIHDFDATKALRAMKKSAEAGNRYGLGAYMLHGYLDVEDEPESVSKTLEYSYDDWCIASFAHWQNEAEDATKYYQRAQYWKNLLDPETHFMRPKKNGSWLSPFDPYQVNNNYTEANSWQYSFFVLQDIRGLIAAMGGPVKFESRLDSLFSTSSSTTGRDQADITGLIGQYAHGNEPSHHMAYLYDYVGKSWKTQQRVRQILSEMYHAAPDGLSGNEDCGQMSAWYVMSALGLYAVTPGSGYLAIGSPLFPKAVIHLEDDKTFTIVANQASTTNAYIQSSKLNGTNFGLNWLKHEQLRNGGELVFEMGPVPEKTFAMTFPPSTMPGVAEALPLVTNPVFSAAGVTFKDSMKVTLHATFGSKMYYTMDGSEPGPYSEYYADPVTIRDDAVFRAVAVNKGVVSHSTTAKYFRNRHPDWKIKILSTYSKQYTAGGDEGIIDGLRADVNWRKGGWQGYQGQDFEAIVDLGKEISVSELGAGFLQDVWPWIFMPKRAEFFLSDDSKKFKKVLTVENTVSDTDRTPQVKDFTGIIPAQKARYVKVKAITYGKLPSWHPGAGYDSHIFIDEIIVK